MELYHTTPCNECPWRLSSAVGWLGGFTPEFYTDAVMNNEVPACHLRDHGPYDPNTAMCAGALSVMSNGCVSAWKTIGGDEARSKVGRRDDTFGHPYRFFEHHAEADYVHPLLRSKAV